MTGLSVIIVNYNAGEFLRRCVQSVYTHAGHFDLQVIIVDNASTDHSLELISDLSDSHNTLILKKNTSNLGFACAVNAGLEEAQKEFVLLLNPDCYIFANTVQSLFEAYKKSPNVGLVGAAIFNEDGTEQRGGRRYQPTLWRSLITMAGLEKYAKGVNQLHEPFPTDVIEVDAVSGAAMLLKTSEFQDLGGMDESYFLHCEDLDLCQTVRQNHKKVMFAPDAIVMHTQGVSGQAMNVQVEKYKHDGMLRYYTKHFAKNIVQRYFMQALIRLRLSLLACFSTFRRSKPHANHLAIPMRQPINSEKAKIIVTGGRSDVGDSIIDLVAKQDAFSNYEIIYISRRKIDDRCTSHMAVHWLHVDFLRHLQANELGSVALWLNLAPVWSGEHFWSIISKFQPQRIVGLSSTSVVTKQHSTDAKEQQLVAQLKSGEAMLAKCADNAAVFILRPTMIYGGKRNKNINVIKKIVRIFHVFPMVGDGAALRQPVHCEDVAQACLQLLEQVKVNGCYIYDLPGKQQFSYYQLVEYVFQALGMRVRIIFIPLSAGRLLLKLLGWLPGMSAISAQAANRMRQDLAFSYEKAQHDFGYQPKDFRP